MGGPILTVDLPPATTIGDRVEVRSDPNSRFMTVVMPDGVDTINGGYVFGFLIDTRGSCYTFVVGEVGNWWIESSYVSPVVE